MEMIAMAAALVMCFAVVLVKVAAGRAIALMERRIANVGQEKQRALNELKMALSQKKVADANRATLEKRKTRLTGKRTRLNEELTALHGDAQHRERVREAVRGKLIRPTRAGNGRTAEDGTDLEPED